MSAQVGDLVRWRCEYVVEPGDDWDRVHETAEATRSHPGHRIYLKAGEAQGIVREVRDNGLFCEEAPSLVGHVGADAWTRTHSTLVAFDRVISVTSPPTPEEANDGN